MIVDANIVISAVLGRSLPLLQLVLGRGLDLYIPAEQHREVMLVTIREGEKQKRDVSGALERAMKLVVRIEHPYYVSLEGAARARLHSSDRAQRDWPLLALALVTGEAIWTHDPDLFGAGIATWKSDNIGFASPKALQMEQEN